MILQSNAPLSPCRRPLTVATGSCEPSASPRTLSSACMRACAPLVWLPTAGCRLGFGAMALHAPSLCRAARMQSQQPAGPTLCQQVVCSGASSRALLTSNRTLVRSAAIEHGHSAYGKGAWRRELTLWDGNTRWSALRGGAWRRLWPRQWLASRHWGHTLRWMRLGRAAIERG